MNISIAGLGYVGLSLACLLAQSHQVTAKDIIESKVQLINEGRSPIRDAEIEQFLRSGKLHLTATCDAKTAYESADFIVVATPTNYDPATSFFDTSSVETCIDEVLSINPRAIIVIKSTVPVGYTKSLVKRYPEGMFLFSPEFLREGKALYDNLHPSRIIVGVPSESSLAEELGAAAKQFVELLADGAVDSCPTIIMRATEAEAVKLFSNTFLALRVAYFNELDTYAEASELDASQIIDGVCLDPRIGSHYNNPSFGYGGYCLPKDTKQLLANYNKVPQELIGAIVEANRTRKDFIAEEISKRINHLVYSGITQPKVGIYRLVMKEGSDNFRSSSVQGIMRRLQSQGIPLVVYEPTLSETSFFGHDVIGDLDEFKRDCDIIVANRWSKDLNDVAGKVFTRDLFRRD